MVLSFFKEILYKFSIFPLGPHKLFDNCITSIEFPSVNFVFRKILKMKLNNIIPLFYIKNYSFINNFIKEK